MWGHYADYDQGISLRFRFIEDWNNIELGKYYFEFDLHDYSIQLLLAKRDPFHNLFYKKKFLKIKYKHKDKLCSMVNLLDSDMTQRWLKVY